MPGDWVPDPIEDKKARARGKALIYERTMIIEVNPHIYRRNLISVSLKYGAQRADTVKKPHLIKIVNRQGKTDRVERLSVYI